MPLQQRSAQLVAQGLALAFPAKRAALPGTLHSGQFFRVCSCRGPAAGEAFCSLSSAQAAPAVRQNESSRGRSFTGEGMELRILEEQSPALILYVGDWKLKPRRCQYSVGGRGADGVASHWRPPRVVRP